MPYQSQMLREQPIESNAPQLFQSLASRLKAFTHQRQNELDAQIQKKGKEQGLIDAQGKTAITLRTGETIADEAWNQGAITSHMAAVKLDITDNLTRIQAENTRDPAGYAVSARGYSQGLLEGVPEGIRPAVQDELSSIILKQGTKITADRNTFERNQHLAQTSTAVDLYRTEGENHAKEGDAEAATEAQLKAIELTNSLEVAGLLDPKSAEIQRNDITRDIEDQIIYGAFARDMDKGKGLQYISRFNKLKALGDRDPDYRKEMSDKMVGMIKDSHTIDADKRKAAEAARKELWRNGERIVANLDLEGALTIEHLQGMVEDGTLDPKVAAKYKQAAMLDGPEFSDQIAINEIRADILSTSDFDIQTDPRISREDQQKLIEERRSIEEDKANWRGTQNGREGARRINQAFGIIKGVDTRISKEKAQRAGMVLTRYFNEVESLPLEERELKTIEISDRLVKEVNNEIFVADLDKAKNRLADAPFQTEEQIKAADLGSEEEKTQIIQLNRKLKRIERLERQIGQ